MIDLSPEFAAIDDLLKRSLAIESISANEGPFTRFISDWARAAGFEVDLWQADEAHLGNHSLVNARHIPLAGRPTLVVTLPADRSARPGRSLMFNAHADVVAAPHPERWTHPPFGGKLVAGRFFGRGACDVKGPMASALGAMLALRRLHPVGLAGDISLELIPGEEDCVGLGTLTSVLRGHKADGLIVLEPTEDQPRCASRGGCRFEITCHGRSVHGTAKWLGDDAIKRLRTVLDDLNEIEKQWNDRAADPLFAGYPIARPITVDSVAAGQWQGMISDRATCAGYLELLPGDDIDRCQRHFVAAIYEKLLSRGDDLHHVEIIFSELYDGHRLDPANPFCRVAEQLIDTMAFSWCGFNSGCEAGLRAGMLGTPTLVWGPGSLAQAHAVDEFVDRASVHRVAERFVSFAEQWCLPECGPSERD